MGDSASIKRVGRPRAPEPGLRLSTWVPNSQFDQIVKVANAHEISVSEFARKALTAALRPKRNTT